jgi:hypothetical protein
MKTMLFKKMILVALVAALALAAFPLTGVSAAAPGDDTVPPAQGQGLSNARLEKVWHRMQIRAGRLDKFFAKSGDLADKAGKMIARFKEAGESTTELEAALKAYESTVKQAKPIYESSKGIVTSHKGFDANGKVTDADQAKATIKQLGGKLGDVHKAMDGTGKALFELMKSILKAHKPAAPGTAN